jgi:hypothetical protein
MDNLKDIVRDFFQSPFWKSDFTMETKNALNECLHPEFERYWHGPDGFLFYKLDDYLIFREKISNVFSEIKFNINHCMQNEESVALRYATYVRYKKNPDALVLRSHFSTIIEFKNSKIYRFYDVSAPADNSEKSLESYG